MKEIIFCNSIKKFSRISRRGGCIGYVICTYSSKTKGLIRLVKSDASQFIGFNFSDTQGSSFLNKFVNFVGELNLQNSSLLWWGLNFTNKNPITTRLCDQASAILSIRDILENKGMEKVLVISDDRALLRQFKIYSDEKGYRLTDAFDKGFDLLGIIKRHIPLLVFFGFFRSFAASIYSKMYCRKRLDRSKEYLVIMSLLSPQSFFKGDRYRDAYFGDFVDYVRKKKLNVVSFLIPTVPFRKYKNMLKNAQRAAEGMPMYSVDYFLGLPSLALCLVRSLGRYYRRIDVKGDMSVDGIDISFLVKESIRKDIFSAQFFDTLKIYYAVRSLSRSLKIKQFYYPFENRAFEKMAILSIKENSPKTRIVGNQHASISMRHTNFFLSKNEVSITPLPDIIMSMGEATKDILERFGNFPKETLRLGCALRHGLGSDHVRTKRSSVHNILVVLATGLDEYVKVLLFLNDAVGRDKNYEIRIRPHPVFDLDHAIKITGKLNFEFSNMAGRTIEECMKWADVVVYVHSTVAIEALAQGLPVLHLKIDNTLNPDPLFDFNEFKWTINSASDLLPVLSNINRMERADFTARQDGARRYVKRYLYPVNEECLEKFLTET